MAAKLKVVGPVFGDERDGVVTLKAPGKPGRKEHPAMAPLPKAVGWLTEVRRYMAQGMSLYEADQIVSEGFYDSHDGKGRKHQPSHLR